MEVEAEHYHLPARTKLEAIDETTIGIYKVIKSRIIRKDAEKIAAMADSIRATDKELGVALICSQNICSKSIRLLTERNIKILYRE